MSGKNNRVRMPDATSAIWVNTTVLAIPGKACSISKSLSQCHDSDRLSPRIIGAGIISSVKKRCTFSKDIVLSLAIIKGAAII